MNFNHIQIQSMLHQYPALRAYIQPMHNLFLQIYILVQISQSSSHGAFLPFNGHAFSAMHVAISDPVLS